MMNHVLRFEQASRDRHMRALNRRLEASLPETLRRKAGCVVPRVHEAYLDGVYVGNHDVTKYQGEYTDTVRFKTARVRDGFGAAASTLPLNVDLSHVASQGAGSFAVSDSSAPTVVDPDQFAPGALMFTRRRLHLLDMGAQMKDRMRADTPSPTGLSYAEQMSGLIQEASDAIISRVEGPDTDGYLHQVQGKSSYGRQVPMQALVEALHDCPLSDERSVLVQTVTDCMADVISGAQGSVPQLGTHWDPVGYFTENYVPSGVYLGCHNAFGGSVLPAPMIQGNLPHAVHVCVSGQPWEAARQVYARYNTSTPSCDTLFDMWCPVENYIDMDRAHRRREEEFYEESFHLYDLSGASAEQRSNIPDFQLFFVVVRASPDRLHLYIVKSTKNARYVSRHIHSCLGDPGSGATSRRLCSLLDVAKCKPVSVAGAQQNAFSVLTRSAAYAAAFRLGRVRQVACNVPVAVVKDGRVSFPDFLLDLDTNYTYAH